MVAWITSHLPLFLALVLGIYEVVARLVPTITNISVLNKIIEVLQWISNFLNRTKKK